MRPIDGDALKESLKESRDNCILWLQDCKEAKSQKWIGRAEQALMTFNGCIMRIDTIPTIEPGIKTGKWIIEIEEEHTEKYDARIPHWFCSCCRTEYDPYFATRVNYCYVCGAKMEVEND